MTLGNAAIYSLLGICVVFFALILLMIAIKVLVKVLPYKEAKAEAPAPAPAKAEPEKAKAPEAKGVAGELKLIKTEPRDAAMIMAIIADELKTPLNQLRFKTIRLVEEDER